MGILSGMFERRSSRTGSAHPRDPAVAEWWGGTTNTASGAIVTPDTAMRVSAVYACVRVISNAVAMLPLLLYRRNPDGSKERAPEESLYRVLHTRPNRWQTAFEFRRMVTAHTLLRGHGCAEIVSTPGGKDELIPRHPDRITPFWAPDDTIAYHYQPLDGPSRVILQEEMLRIKALDSDILEPQSPIKLHRESIGLAMATEEHGARLFSNGAQVGGVLQHPGRISADAAKTLRESWEKRYAGGANAHRTAVLEEGMTFNKIGMTSEDAQFLETRKYQVTDIARIFGVPPHKIGDLEKATFSNIEEQSQEFYTDCVGPWLVNWEQAIHRDVIPESKQDWLFAEFLIDALLRANIEQRYKAYAIGRQWGWLNADEIRGKENQNPLPDGQGQTYLSPMNMISADKVGQQEPKNDPAQA